MAQTGKEIPHGLRGNDQVAVKGIQNCAAVTVLYTCVRRCQPVKNQIRNIANHNQHDQPPDLLPIRLNREESNQTQNQKGSQNSHIEGHDADYDQHRKHSGLACAGEFMQEGIAGNEINNQSVIHSLPRLSVSIK